MTDYRLQALKRALHESQARTAIDLKEGGGLVPGILDENAGEKQREYLEMLETVFQKMKAGELDPEETKSTLLALIQVFNDECEELAELCHIVGGFDDLKSHWEQQNEELCRSLHEALGYYENRDSRVLEVAFERIVATMNERLPLYAKMEDVEQIYDEEFEEDELPEVE